MVISASFTFYRFTVGATKLEVFWSIISRSLPFIIATLGIFTLINLLIEKYLERENGKEFLKILGIQVAVILCAILFQAYDFYKTAII
jgi:hypothetical protein